MKGLRKGRGRGEKPKDTLKTLKRLFSFVLHHKWHLAIVVVCIILSVASTVVATSMLKPLIDSQITPLIGVENPNFSSLISFIILLSSVYLIGIVTSYIYNRIMIAISTGVLSSLRHKMFSHMQTLSLEFYDSHPHGELMSRYTNDIDAIREMISQGLPHLISSVLTIVGTLIAMFILSPFLSVIMISLVAITGMVVTIITKKGAKYFKQQQAQLGKVNGYIEEMIDGQKVVKVFEREEMVVSEFNALNEELFETSKNANIFGNMLYPIVVNITNIQYVFLAIVGGLLAINNVFAVGTILAFIQFGRLFVDPIAQLSQQVSGLLMALAGAERIFEILDTAPEVDNGTVTLVKTITKNGKTKESQSKNATYSWKVINGNEVKFVPLRGDVWFNNVTFGYRAEKNVLKNMSLYAKPGQKIAFVGSTGAGKTTIINLLNRFYDVKEGQIVYDGINILDIKKNSLRQSLSLVLQDTHLFSGTIRENIAYGKPGATDKEVERAAILANAQNFISTQKDGYETMLTNDGSNFSQGQRQLLAIARAAISQPPVLILDEATSSIDTRTEKLIENGLSKLMENKTVFVIAHRLSTIKNSHAIIVLEHGEIIERGNHGQLIDLNGRYHQLYMGMFELF